MIERDEGDIALFSQKMSFGVVTARLGGKG
jgi:hypothetical protein